jgi:hypothetical protein
MAENVKKLFHVRRGMLAPIEGVTPCVVRVGLVHAFEFHSSLVLPIDGLSDRKYLGTPSISLNRPLDAITEISSKTNG